MIMVGDLKAIQETPRMHGGQLCEPSNSSSTRENLLLLLLVTNRSELIWDTKIEGSLGCRDHVLLEHAVLRDMRKVRSKVRPLNFRKTGFQLFRKIASGMSWETVLDDKGV